MADAVSTGAAAPLLELAGVEAGYGTFRALYDVSLTVGARLFGASLADLPNVARISDACLAEPAFAAAHPLRQPGAPQGA